MKSFSVFSLGLTGCLFLAGCSAVPVSSMLALSRIDFTTTHLQDMRVAVELPETIRPQAKSVTLDLGVIQGRTNEKYQFNLVPVGGQTEPKALQGLATKGRNIFAYKLRDADVRTIEELRARMLASKEAGKKGALSLGVGAKEFCRASAFPDGPLRASTFISTTETGGYVAVVKDYDLRDDPAVAASLINLPDCDQKTTPAVDAQ